MSPNNQNQHSAFVFSSCKEDTPGTQNTCYKDQFVVGFGLLWNLLTITEQKRAETFWDISRKQCFRSLQNIQTDRNQRKRFLYTMTKTHNFTSVCTIAGKRERNLNIYYNIGIFEFVQRTFLDVILRHKQALII